MHSHIAWPIPSAYHLRLLLMHSNDRIFLSYIKPDVAACLIPVIASMRQSVGTTSCVYACQPPYHSHLHVSRLAHIKSVLRQRNTPHQRGRFSAQATAPNSTTTSRLLDLTTDLMTPAADAPGFPTPQSSLSRSPKPSLCHSRPDCPQTSYPALAARPCPTRSRRYPVDLSALRIL